MRRGFSVNGYDISDSFVEGTSSNFNEGGTWKFPDGTYRRFRKWDSSQPTDKQLTMSTYKQNGIAVESIRKK